MAVVKRQLISRITGSTFEETDKSMKRWKLELEDYNIILEFAKGIKNEAGEWDWSNAIRFNLSDQDIDSLYTTMNEFSRTVKSKSYQLQQSTTDPSTILTNSFIVTRDSKYIISMWCTIKTQEINGNRRGYRECEFRIYEFDKNWDNIKILRQDSYNKREYSVYSQPIFTFRLSNQARVNGAFVYEDLEVLSVIIKGIESCILKDSAVFVDHYRNVREANAAGNQSENVGYNKTIPNSSEPAAPSIVTDEMDLPF